MIFGGEGVLLAVENEPKLRYANKFTEMGNTVNKPQGGASNRSMNFILWKPWDKMQNNTQMGTKLVKNIESNRMYKTEKK